MKVRKRKWAVRILIGFLLFNALLLYFYIPRFIVEIDNTLIKLVQKAPASASVNIPINSSSFETEIIHFNTKDSLLLEAEVKYPNYNKNEEIIILLHGIRSDKGMFTEVSEDLAKKGFTTVALDLRAHGNSQGKFCTYGAKESDDILELIQYLKENNNEEANFGIWGFSLGGATALQAMAKSKELKYGVIESSFQDMPQITHSYVDRIVDFNFQPLTNFLIYRAGKIADFIPKEANAFKAAQQIHQPILITHGKRDKRIHYQIGKNNFNVTPSKSKKFLLVEDAIHTTLWRSKEIKYLDFVYEFLDNTIRNYPNTIL